MNDNEYQQEINYLSQRHNLEPIEIHLFDCLDSTNNKLWELIDRDLELPAATVALQQTFGKGQWGKNWQSQIGGLYLSVAFECDLALDNSFHLVMATAEGITNILHSYKLPVTIKWSNDLILDNRKLGGIKIETKSQNGNIKYAVVGVGVNWKNPVPKIGINLKDYYQKIKHSQQLQMIDSTKSFPYIKSLEELTAIITIGILQGYQNYLQWGIAYTHQNYRQLLNSLNKQIAIDNNSGIIKEVTTEGKLKIDFSSHNAKSSVYFSPGEISLGY